MSYLVPKKRIEKNKKKAPKVFIDIWEVSSIRKKSGKGRGKPRQVYICKVGALRNFLKISSAEVNIDEIKTLDYQNALRKVFASMLENHGFKKKGLFYQFDDVIVDLSKFEAYSLDEKKPIAIPVNGGYLATKTMQDLANIKLSDLEDEVLYKKMIESWQKAANKAGLYDTFTIDENKKINKKDIYGIRKELSKKLSDKKISGKIMLCQALLHLHPDYKVFQSKIDTNTGMQKASLNDFYKEMGFNIPKKPSFGVVRK